MTVLTFPKKEKNMRGLVTALLLLLPLAAGAEVYRWVDQDGNVHFTDRPRNTDAKVVDVQPQVIHRDTSPPATVTPSPAVRRLDQLEKREAEREAARLQAKIDRLRAQQEAGPSPLCEFARQTLRQYERELDRLQRRGYKQSEKLRAEDNINEWSHRVQDYCD